MEENNKIRLQKYLANCGVASRRKSEEYILQGLIKVNEEIVKDLGTKIDINKDKVYYKNKLIKNDTDEKVYILLNKPIGYVTTAKEQFGRDAVLDLIKTDKRLVPVGRLDMYTSRSINTNK